MQAKLTLSVDKTVVLRAKKYALRRKKSLSQIIEDYLKTLSSNETANKYDSDSIPPITKSLAGVLRGKDEVEFRSSIADYLEKKYK